MGIPLLGCRALNPKEVQLISNELSLRNRCIFILGIRTGFRIRELLSLDIQDVVDERGNVRGIVRVNRCNMKGGESGRSMPIHPDAKKLLAEYLRTRRGAAPSEPLFQSTGTGGKAKGRLEYTVFHEALAKACTRARIQDAHLVSTHSLRKTFASNMNEAVNGNIFELQALMGHKHISSTAKYISVNNKKLFELVLKQK